MWWPFEVIGRSQWREWDAGVRRVSIIPIDISRLLKFGVCRGTKPLAGSLRACPERAEGVSLRYNFPSLPDMKGSGG